MRLSRRFFRLSLSGLGLLASTIAAAAEPAAAITDLNVRSGSGTRFRVLDTLTPGEVVDIRECRRNGWCRITHDGPEGWVASNYLTTAPGVPGGGPECRLRISRDADGPGFAFACAGGAAPADTPASEPPAGDQAPAPGAPPVGDQACFYVEPNFGGASFCYGAGILPTLNAQFTDKISSVRVFGAGRARLCVEQNLKPFCRNVTADMPMLGPLMNDKASSVAVYTGAWVEPNLTGAAPSIHATGPLNIPATWTANLDNGVMGGDGTDIWYRVYDPATRFIEPQNGALLALGDGSDRGYDGCAAADFTTDPIPLMTLPVGSFVCARTDEGRISQFRVNGYAWDSLQLGCVTFAN
ncbi:SH3 domain-containing protein [Rhodobacter ferrooxidans]|uniref:SH3 type 3 domain protein n=1 Tax=Rhodobacter ferrooxidans TaxID=371731 RepID=C8S2Y6_9RHOB|nr:SH3 domain-containing protein [Rhodobacter sp. SW2]EEW24626.1 SH3 type 3 domain protein [Rhodobacter sp. SW2]